MVLAYYQDKARQERSHTASPPAGPRRSAQLVGRAVSADAEARARHFMVEE